MSTHQTYYKRHQIIVDRRNALSNWYIQVISPDGGYVYDGWWRDSQNKTYVEAIEEGKFGSMLKKRRMTTTATREGE